MRRTEFDIKGLGCAGCAVKIQEAANRIEGVANAKVHFELGKISLELTGADEARAIKELKKTVASIEQGARLVTGKEPQNTGIKGYILPVSGAILYIFALIVPEGVLKTVLFLVSYILLGLNVFMDSARNIAKGRIFDENLLMVLATAGALAIGEYPEAVAVMLFFRIGEMLQALAVEKSRRSIRGLAGLYPDEATVQNVGGEKKIPAADVQPGDILVIRPGEKVCVDSVVVEGEGFVDTQAVTGEPVPKRVTVGDEILSGYINTQSVIKARALRLLADSAASKIMHMVQDAVERKSRTESAITRFARVYTPAVIAFVLLLMFLPPLIGLGALDAWVYRGLVFLAASCPCALVLSVPLAYFGGIGRASRQGVLVKGGNYLESFASTRAMVFDKTGTLTEGVFQVTGIFPENGFDEKELLKYASGAESASAHPIAKSIIQAAGAVNGEDAKEFSGLGVSALVEGKTVLAGSEALLLQYGVTTARPEGYGTVVHVAVDGAYAGHIRIADRIRANAAETVTRLKKMGVSKLYLYTGDNETGAAYIAEQAGLTGYYHSMRPEDKVERLKELKKSYPTAFAGDGINDAPSIAAADTGIAVGGAREMALEAADIVLIGSDLAAIPDALGTARLTGRVARENIVFSVSVKAVVLVLGALGLASIWAAVVADTVLALLAVANSLRIVLKRLL